MKYADHTVGPDPHSQPIRDRAPLSARGRPPTLLLVTAAAALLALSSLSGCAGCAGELIFEDDVGASDFVGISQPYGTGGTAVITVKRQQFIGATSEPSWQASSSDDDVFIVDRPRYEGDSDTFRVDVIGVGAGTADLIISSDDAEATEYGRQPLRVVQPDAVRIAAADHFWDGTTEQEGVPAVDTELRVVPASNVTLLTDVTHIDEPVFGRGMVEVISADAALSTTMATTTFGRARDWIELRRTGEGSSELDIQVGKRSMRQVDVVAVNANVVDRLVLFPAATRNAEEGDQLAVVCHGADDESRPIYGLPCQWRFDDEAVDDPGVVLTYAYAPGDAVAVSAQLDADRIADPITVEGANPTVRDADKLGCDATQGGSAAPLLPLLVVASLRLRRRRPPPRGSRAAAATVR